MSYNEDLPAYVNSEIIHAQASMEDAPAWAVALSIQIQQMELKQQMFNNEMKSRLNYVQNTVAKIFNSQIKDEDFPFEAVQNKQGFTPDYQVSLNSIEGMDDEQLNGLLEFYGLPIFDCARKKRLAQHLGYFIKSYF